VRANKRPTRAAAAAAAAAGVAAFEEDESSSSSEQEQATASMEYDSSEMSDGCNMASGVLRGLLALADAARGWCTACCTCHKPPRGLF
jgi:hypothetical protein